MKKSLTNTMQVAHIWDQMRTPDAVNYKEKFYTRSTHTQDGVFYSYDSPIARWASHDTVIVYSGSTTKTTGKHLDSVRAVVPAMAKVLRVYYDYQSVVCKLPECIKYELRYQLKTIKGYKDKILKARSSLSAYYSFNSMYANYLAVCKFFGVQPEVIELSEAELAKVKQIEKVQEKKAKAIAEANRLYQEQLEIARQWIMDNYPNAGNDIIDRWRNSTNNLYNITTEFAVEIKAKLPSESKVSSFIFNILNQMYYEALDGKHIIRKVGDNIQTSGGAAVSLSDARKVLLAMKSQSPHLNGMRVGHFTVTGIKDGRLHIGCHQFNIESEMPMLEQLLTHHKEP